MADAGREGRWDIGVWDEAVWDGDPNAYLLLTAVRRAERATAKVAQRVDE